MTTLDCVVSRAGRNAGLLSLRATARQALASWQALERARTFEFEAVSRGERVSVKISVPEARMAAALLSLDEELTRVQLLRGTPRSFAEPFPERPGAHPGRRR